MSENSRYKLIQLKEQLNEDQFLYQVECQVLDEDCLILLYSEFKNSQLTLTDQSFVIQNVDEFMIQLYNMVIDSPISEQIDIQQVCKNLKPINLNIANKLQKLIDDQKVTNSYFKNEIKNWWEYPKSNEPIKPIDWSRKDQAIFEVKIDEFSNAQLRIRSDKWNQIVSGERVSIQGTGFVIDNENYDDYWEFENGLDGNLLMKYCREFDDIKNAIVGFNGITRKTLKRSL